MLLRGVHLGFGFRAGLEALAEDWVLLATLQSLQRFHDLDGGGFDLLALLVELAGTQDDSSVLTETVSHVRLDPDGLVVGDTDHFDGFVQVLTVDLGEVVAVEVADLLGVGPTDWWSHDDEIVSSHLLVVAWLAFVATALGGPGRAGTGGGGARRGRGGHARVLSFGKDSRDQETSKEGKVEDCHCSVVIVVFVAWIAAASFVAHFSGGGSWPFYRRTTLFIMI